MARPPEVFSYLGHHAGAAGVVEQSDPLGGALGRSIVAVEVFVCQPVDAHEVETLQQGFGELPRCLLVLGIIFGGLVAALVPLAGFASIGDALSGRVQRIMQRYTSIRTNWRRRMLGGGSGTNQKPAQG